VRRRRDAAGGIRAARLVGATAAALLLTLPPAGPAIAQPDPGALARQARAQGCAPVAPTLQVVAATTGLDAQRASLLLGWCRLQAAQADAAADAFAAAAGHPTLGPYARLYHGRALTAAGRAGAAVEVLRPLAADAPPRLRGRALAALGAAHRAQGRAADGSEALAAAAELIGDDVALWLQAGEAAAAAGQRDRARRAYARAAWAFPGDPRAQTARAALARLLGRPIAPSDIDPASRLARARVLGRAGEWAEAERELRAATAAASTGPLAAEAWFRLGERILATDARGAHAAYRRALALGWDAAPSWYWAAVAARRAGLAAQAAEATAAMLRAAPTGEWPARHWYAVGLRAESSGRAADAEAAYRRAGAAARDASAAVEARWRLGWVALRARRHAEATARFRAAAEAAPWRGEAARAWYWSAKALEASGAAGRDQAHGLLRMVADRYPVTFYGQRARARLGLGASDPPPPPDASADGPAPGHDELLQLGFDADAADAAADAFEQDRDPRTARALAVAWDRLGDVVKSVAFAEDALAGGVRDQDTWRLAYPRAYWPQTQAAAAAAGIDPHLLLALVREESRYEAAVVSPARAVGLAQLLPSTASGLAGRTVTLQQLKDPETNLRLGARYLRAQLDRFRGDLRLAAAAYNAGPGAASRWVDLDADPDYFVERIPYAETRAYVRRVLGSYGVYRWLW
jgi:soluble lytic murein transglycosylase